MTLRCRRRTQSRPSSRATASRSNTTRSSAPWRRNRAALVPLALPRPLPALVPLVVPPTALPGLSAALVAALYPEPDRDVPDTWAPLPTALATVQLKAEGAFVSISARTEQELTDALRMLAGRVRRATGAALPLADRERRIAYVDGTWYSE